MMYDKDQSEAFLARRQDWRADGIADPYYMLASLFEEATSYMTRIRSLEICCADGLASTHCKEARNPSADDRWFGVEGSHDLVDMAPEWMQVNVGDAHMTMWPSDMDIVIAPFCLYHLMADQIIMRVGDVLSPGGTFINTVMQPHALSEMFHQWAGLPISSPWLEIDYGMLGEAVYKAAGLKSVSRHWTDYTVNFGSVDGALSYYRNTLRSTERDGEPDGDPPTEATMKIFHEVWEKV